MWVFGVNVSGVMDKERSGLLCSGGLLTACSQRVRSGFSLPGWSTVGSFPEDLTFHWRSVGPVSRQAPLTEPTIVQLQQHWRTTGCSGWSLLWGGQTQVHILVLPQRRASLGKLLNSSAPSFLSSVKWGCSRELHHVAVQITHAAPGSVKMSFFLFSGYSQWKKIPRGLQRRLQLGGNLLPMYAVYYTHRSHVKAKKDFASGFVWKPLITGLPPVFSHIQSPSDDCTGLQAVWPWPRPQFMVASHSWWL